MAWYCHKMEASLEKLMLEPIQNWLQKRRNNNLGDAIIAKDVNKIRKALASGANAVDKTKGFGAPYGFVADQRFTDPALMGVEVGLSAEGMTVLAQYGFHPANPDGSVKPSHPKMVT